MVIEQSDIESLLRYDGEGQPVVSLYLNVTPPRDYTTELKSLIREKSKELDESTGYSEDQLHQLDRLLEKIEQRVRAVGRWEATKLLVVFADNDRLWQEYRLPVSLPSKLVVAPDPYTRPLTMLLDEFQRHCVVVADSRSARIFTLYLGEFEKYPDMYIQREVPDRVRAKDSMTTEGGGDIWGGLGDQRIQRHIENHIHRHLKDVGQRAFRLFKTERFDRLILAGPDDKLLSWVKDHLHSYLKERVVGEFFANPENSKTDLKEKALEAAEKYERLREKKLIEQLLELKAPGGKAVLGVEPTLEALMLGQVHTLVVQHDFAASGYLCPRDRILSTYLKSCPLCEEPMHEVEDLADKMVEEALSQNAEVEHIFIDHDEFREHGVGALLRFTV